MAPEIFKLVKSIQCAASGNHCEPADGKVVVEQSVRLTVNGEDWLFMVCTPREIDALAVGFLYNEGILQSMDEVVSCQVSPAFDWVDVRLSHPAARPDQWHRTTTTLTGLAEENPQVWRAPCRNEILLEPAQVPQLFRKFILMQTLHNEIGGVHSAALSDGQEIHMVIEDIGRHNTLDKLAGLILLQHAGLEPRIILMSGRISSEMLFKTQRMGACMVISRTAPTAHAIQLAEEWGITLVGYARGERFMIYTHPERILHTFSG